MQAAPKVVALDPARIAQSWGDVGVIAPGSQDGVQMSAVLSRLEVLGHTAGDVTAVDEAAAINRDGDAGINTDEEDVVDATAGGGEDDLYGDDGNDWEEARRNA
jgi:hypothetical protein